ncbi:MAG TPA: hypothetical protein VFA34_12475, partial [Actinomycetota bacterium]|nr:hypothetical protein [Actinomycetota bacterium]
MIRRISVFSAALLPWALPAIAQAQETKPLTPNLNWVFLLSLVVLLGFLAFIAFVSIYYVLGVV